MTTTQQLKRQFPRNIIAAVLSFFVLTVSAVLLTPYLVNHLGPAAYGLIPLAALLTQYVAIIASQISLAVRRFLVIEAQKPGGNPSIVFNSALALFLTLIVVQIPIFAVVIYKVDAIFTIPPELLRDAQILFVCSAASFLLSLLFGVFGISIYAENRLDISSTIELSRGVGRLVFIVAFFSVFGPGLRFIGYTDLLMSIFAGLAKLYYWRKLTPELMINVRHIDVKMMKPIFKMSFWTLVNNIGALLYVRTDIWIINKFISPVAAGQYAAIMVILNFIKQLGRLISNQFGPTTIAYCAKSEWDALRKLIQMSMKMTAVLIAVPIGVICVTAPELLKTWLGDDFVSLSPVVWLVIGHLFINVGVYPLIYCVQPALNQVKLPGLVTFFMGIANVTCVYTLGVALDMGVVGVALGGAIVLSMKNAMFTTLHGAAVLGLPKTVFIRPLMSSLLVFLLILVINWLPVANWAGFSSGYAYLGVTAAYLSAVSVVFIWFVLINTREKRLLADMIPGKVGLRLRKRAGCEDRI